MLTPGAVAIFKQAGAQQMVATTETAELAEELINAAVVAQGVEKGTLTIHADRGTSMASKGVAELLSDLGVGRTHSRPHVSNDELHAARLANRELMTRLNLPRPTA